MVVIFYSVDDVIRFEFLHVYIGVFRRSDDIEVFIDITAIKELRSHRITNDGLLIGASVSLTELMSILTENAKRTDFEYVAELVNHIDLIANVPVRNVRE